MRARVYDTCGNETISPAVAVQISNDEVSEGEDAEEKIRASVTGATDFEIAKPTEAGAVVNASDYGVSENAAPAANAAALQSAIDYCKRTGASVLKLEGGTYYVSRENKTQLEFNGLKNFTLDGGGARLVFCETENTFANARFIYIASCDTVRIKNLTVDWDWDSFALFITGKISEVGTNTITVKSDKYDIPDYVSIYHTKGWDYEADNVTPKVYGFGKTVKSTEKVSDKEIKYTYTSNVTGARVGDGAQIAFKPRLNAGAFHLEDNVNLSFYNVEINAAPYEGVNSTGDKYLEFDNCRLSPGEGRRFSSYGGFEVHAMRGYFKFTNNTVSGVLDDNLHLSNHYYGGGLKVEDAYTVTAEYLQQWSGIKYAYAGAELELRSSSYAPKGWRARVVSYKWNYNVYNSANAHGVTLTFDKPLPWNIDETDCLFNTDMDDGQYLIENNTMYGGLCHAMYIGLANGTIRNNNVECFAYPALIVNTVRRWTRWYIGNPIRNVIISGNSLKNTNLNKRDPASLFVGAGTDYQPTDYYPTEYMPTQDVLVENNRIEGSGLIAMGTWSSRNILFADNEIINPNLYENKDRFKGYGRMYATNCSNVHFDGNTVEITADVYGEDGIYTSEATDVYINGTKKKEG